MDQTSAYGRFKIFFEEELRELGVLDMKVEHYEFGDFRLF